MDRRAFLAGSGAAASQIAQAQIAQPKTLSLLGLHLPVQWSSGSGSGSVSLADSDISISNGMLDVQRLAMRFKQCSVFLRFKLPVDTTGSTIRLKPGKYPGEDGYAFLVSLGEPLEGSELVLKAGPLRIGGGFRTGRPAMVVDPVDGLLRFRLTNFTAEPTDFTNRWGKAAPLELKCAGGDPGGLVLLDLSARQVEICDGSFDLHTSVVTLAGDAFKHPSEQVHALRAFRFDLDALGSSFPLTFRGSNSPLPLHVEKCPRAGGGQMVIGAQITGYDLRVTLQELKPSGVPQMGAGRLELVSSGKAKIGPRLQTFALADLRNRTLEWQLPQSVSLPLKLRPAGTNWPATLLMAPPLALSGAAQGGIPVQPIGLQDRQFHGDLNDSVLMLGAAPRLASATLPHALPSAQDVSGFAPDLVSATTSAFVGWETGTTTAFERARPGRAYRAEQHAAANESDISRYGCTGPAMSIPAVPMQVLTDQWQDYAMAFAHQLDAWIVPGMSAMANPVVHESLRHESVGAGGHVPLQTVFAPAPTRTPARGRPQRSPAAPDQFTLGKHKVTHGFRINNPASAGPGNDVGLSLTVTRPANAEPDYIIVEANGSLDEADIPKLNFQLSLNNVDFVLDASRDVTGLTPAQNAAGGASANLPKALLKLARTQKIEDILSGRAGFPKLIAPYLPDSVKRAEWVGVIFFGVPAMPGVGSSLEQLVPSDAVSGSGGQDGIRFSYVALTPDKGRQVSPDRISYSVSAYLSHTFANEPSEADAVEQEATFSLQSVTGYWDDSCLQSMVVQCQLQLRSFLGLSTGHMSPIAIEGLFDRATGKLAFSARPENPIELLPADNAANGEAPIKQVLFKGAVITFGHDNPHIAIDGAVILKPFKVGPLPSFDLSDVDFNTLDFSGLGIELPHKPTLKLQWSSITYPSLKMNFDGPSFKLGAMSLRPISLGIDFHGNFSWDSLVLLDKKPPSGFPCLLFGIRIELMRLPAILDASIPNLCFDLQVGAWAPAGATRWTFGQMTVAVSALGFDKLHLDLFRFIEFSVDHISMSHDANQTTWIRLENAALKVAGYQLFSNVDAAFFVREGFNGYLVRITGNDTVSLFNVQWALFGHNVVLSDSFVEKQLAFSQPPDTDNSAATAARKELNGPVDNFLPSAVKPATRNTWVIGAGIQALAGFFAGRFIYEEGHVCALSLDGAFLDWIGLNTGIVGAYFKGEHPEQDHFYIAMGVPAIAVGDIMFTGGVIAVDMGVGGDFQLDLGFPWQTPAGSREWYRALGAILTPFQGSGGLYVERRSHALSDPLNGDLFELAGGYAVQAGLGAVFGGGVFTVFVTIGMYATIEGAFYLKGSGLQNVHLHKVHLAGAVGVLFRGHGSLRFWIISLDIDITVGAEAGTTIEWEEGKQMLVQLDFAVYATATASACIRVGFVHVCKGISVSIPMTARYNLRL